MCLGSSPLQAADRVRGSELLFAGFTRKVLTAVATSSYCSVTMDLTINDFLCCYCCGFALSSAIGCSEINTELLFHLGNAENRVTTCS